MRHSLLALSVAVSSLATGCAGPRLVARFVPDDRLRWDKAQYPDAPLVAMHRARSTARWSGC